MNDCNKLRNAQRTKNKILKVAEKTFAKNGYARTTLKEISKKSNTSTSLIVFHFKNKKNLYASVKSAIVKRYISDNSNNVLTSKSTEGKIEFIINSTFKFYKENPTMLKLSNWAILEGDIDPWPGEDELHHNFIKIIEDLQLSDEIRSDLTPMYILIMISGSIHIWWEYHKHFINHFSDIECIDDKYKTELISFILQGLKK